MKFKQIRLEDGSRIPFGYGIAWRDFACDNQVLYPIPFNIIIRWLRDFWFWLMTIGRPGYKEKIERIAYLHGRNSNLSQIQSNYNFGYNNGLIDGWNRAFDDLEKGIKK